MQENAVNLKFKTHFLHPVQIECLMQIRYLFISVYCVFIQSGCNLKFCTTMFCCYKRVLTGKICSHFNQLSQSAVRFGVDLLAVLGQRIALFVLSVFVNAQQ